MDDDATVLEQVFRSFPAEFRALNEYEAKAMLNRLGIPDHRQRIGTLSGGQRKRVALAAALIHPADVLILDEPTNHLDTEMVTWLEERLKRFRGGLVMVTHDRYFLERVVNRITELSRGKLYHYEANYSKYLELKEQRLEMAEASERKRQSILRVEREWIMRGCKARTTKSKERIQRYEALLGREAPETDEALSLAAASSRLGKQTIELREVTKSFDGRTVLDRFSYNVLRGDRIGIVGHNGVGKSTLLRLIAGELQPDSGSVTMGATVKLGHFSQEGRELDLNQRVYDFIHDIADEVRTDEGTFTANQMMERFLFPGDLQSQPIGRLSGGERRRLYLLSILMTAPNILLLDEPTNDLDVTTLAILEDYLQSFPGPILTVSHDRFFLDKLADSIFEVRDGGQVLRYTGNWSDWAEKRRAEETVKTERPRATVEKPREKRPRLTYQEQLELRSIDGELAALEQELKDCEAAMGGCGSDYVRLQELTEQQTALQARLEEKTERWLYLTELQEQVTAWEASQK
jgi:ATP-binding cassette subfamily F protein uup